MKSLCGSERRRMVGHRHMVSHTNVLSHMYVLAYLHVVTDTSHCVSQVVNGDSPYTVDVQKLRKYWPTLMPVNTSESL